MNSAAPPAPLIMVKLKYQPGNRHHIQPTGPLEWALGPSSVHRLPSTVLPLLLLIAAFAIAAAQQPSSSLACQRIYYNNQWQEQQQPTENVACRCDANHCDSFHFDWPQDDRTYLRVVSGPTGARFEQSHMIAAAAQPQPQEQADYLVAIDAGVRRQEVLGYGGAFTDSAARMISSLKEPLRQRLLDDYFGERGLDYNLARVPISGTDMSSRAYSYDDMPDGQQDFELAHFKLQPEDLEHKIPLIQRVNSMRRARQLEPLKLMAASWGAPAWMKSNDDLVQGQLKGNSTGPYYDAYARYLIKFLHHYEQHHNVSIWAMSPQNEPLSPRRVGPKLINFNSVNFRPDEMADWLEYNLVPHLLRAGKTRNKLKLFIWDDCLDGLSVYQEACLSRPLTRDYTSGLAIHWYGQALRGTAYEQLHETRRQLPPSYAFMSTEACFLGGPHPGSWSRAQRYARDLIEHLRVGSVGWIDWNLALSMSGGPTWSHNYLDSAVLVDSERQVYYKNPMYYALGHVARFVPAGSSVVPSTLYERTTRSTGGTNSGWQTVSTGPAEGEVMVAAAELGPVVVASANSSSSSSGGPLPMRRRFSLVVLNRAPASRRLQLRLAECRAKQDQPPLVVELPAGSLVSLAFVC